MLPPRPSHQKILLVHNCRASCRFTPSSHLFFNNTQQLHSRTNSTLSSIPYHRTPNPPPAAPTPPLAPLPHIQPRSAPLPNAPPPAAHRNTSTCQHLNHPRRKSPAASSWKESKQLDSHETKTKLLQAGQSHFSPARRERSSK